MRWTVLLASFVALCLSSVSFGGEKTKILLVGKNRDHPYATHEYMVECRLLAKCLQQTKGIETIVSNGWPTDPEMLKDVDAIVLYTRNGGDVILSPKARKQVLAMLKNGVGLTAIHWSTGANNINGPEYKKILGGWFSRPYAGSRLNTTNTKLLQADGKHPICRGWDEYDLRDEYYLDLKFQEDIHPVMQVKLDKKVHTVGWTYKRADGGKSFGFVCGHFHANFGEPKFRKAIVNGILWTADVEVPKTGASVNVTKKDLELPPKGQK